MNDTVIFVEGLTKTYHIGAKEDSYRTFRDVVSSAFVSPFRLLGRWIRNSNGIKPSNDEIIYALQDVSFEVKRGEVLGVIGRNGAGKSTLLKILSRITEPTNGYAEIRGRVGSLLEVGTGFHPELTGRENIYLNGAILGMKKAEIEQKFDEIVAFSELEKFLDTPVKHYSSGMYVRLAFAVAAHLEPEVFLVDEVLAVGDFAFQRKCIRKMQDVSQHGHTVLFVSHNMAALESLCQRALVLSAGKISLQGTTEEAITRYLSDSSPKLSIDERSDRIGTGQIRITQIEYRDQSRRSVKVLRSGQPVDIILHFEVSNLPRRGNVIASVIVKTQMDMPIFLLHNKMTGNIWDDLPDRGSFICHIKRLPLPASMYILGYSLIRNGEYLDAVSNAQEIVVEQGDFFGTGDIPPISHGVCLVEGEWRLEA